MGHRRLADVVVLALVTIGAHVGCGDDDAPTRSDGGVDGSVVDALIDAAGDGDATARDGGGDAGSVARWVCGESGPDPRFLDELGAWQRGFVLPGARGVAAMATAPDGALLVGGSFEHVSGVVARHVARVVASGAIEPMAGGLADVVTAIGVASDGVVYAATGPTPETWALLSLEERDLAQAAVHRWDGTAWSRVGVIDGGAIFGVAIDDDGRVYVIGDFAAIDGVEARHFAVLEDDAWREAEPLASMATALFSDDDGVCFAGWVDDPPRMKVACGVVDAFVEHVLPASFAQRILPSAGGFFGISPPIATIARDVDGALVIGGDFTFDGFAEGLGSLARWDGARFVPLAGGVGYDPSRDFEDWGVVQDLERDEDGSLVVAGAYTRAGTSESAEMHGLARIRDGAWVDVPSADLRTSGIGAGVSVGIERFRIAARAPEGVAIAGRFSAIEGVASQDVALFDGAAWRSIGSSDGLRGLDGEVRALASRGSVVIAGGAFVSDGAGVVHPFLAEHRDGEWLGSTAAPGVIGEVAIASDGTLWAAASPSEFEGTVLLVRGSLDALDDLGRAEGGELAPEITSIVTTADGRAFAGGSFATMGGIAAANVAEITGTTIRALGAGVHGRVEALAIDASGDLVAVGSFTEAGGVAAAHVARWRAGAWEPIGGGLDAELTGLAIHEGDVVVSARFDPRAGASDRLVACFDGSEWRDVASHAFPMVSGGTTRLLSAGGTLVLLGQIPFDALDPSLTAKVVVFTGDDWRAVDASRGDFAYDGAAANDGFWLGGSFASVDGVPADQIAFFAFDIE